MGSEMCIRDSLRLHANLAGPRQQSVRILFHSLNVHSWIQNVAFLLFKWIFHHDDVAKSGYSKFIAAPNHADRFAIFDLWGTDFSHTQ